MTKEPEIKSNSTPIIIGLDEEEKIHQFNLKLEANEKALINHAIYIKKIEYLKINKDISKGNALYLIIQEWLNTLKGES